MPQWPMRARSVLFPRTRVLLELIGIKLHYIELFSYAISINNRGSHQPLGGLGSLIVALSSKNGEIKDLVI